MLQRGTASSLLTKSELDEYGKIPTSDIEWIPDLCNPMRPLDYDAQSLLGVDLTSVQGGDVLASIAKKIMRSKRARQVHLISGLSGSGKSTQILGLMAQLNGSAQGLGAESRRLRTVYVDVLEYLSIQDLDFSWILLGVLSELVKQFPVCAKASKHLTAAWSDIRTVLDSADIGITAQVDLGFIKLAGALKSAPESRSKLRLRLPPISEQLIDHVNAFAQELREKHLPEAGYDDIVLILDNLEKTVPSPTSDTRDSFETTFYDGAPLFSRLDLHLVMTVPAALCYRDVQAAALSNLYANPPIMVPMVRVRERETGGPYAAGIAKMREVLAKRVDLGAVFGGDTELLDEVCGLSGGSVRRLLQLVSQLSLEVDELPVGQPELKRVLDRLAATMDRGLPQEHLPAAAASATRAEEGYSGVGSLLGQADAALLLGTIRFRQGDYSAATSAFDRADLGYATIGSELNRTKAWAGLSQVHRAQGDLTTAISLVQRAADVQWSLKDSPAWCLSQRTLAAWQPTPEATAHWLDEARKQLTDAGQDEFLPRLSSPPE